MIWVSCLKMLYFVFICEECFFGSDFLLGLILVFYIYVEFMVIGFLGIEILILGVFFVCLFILVYLVLFVER